MSTVAMHTQLQHAQVCMQSIDTYDKYDYLREGNHAI